MSDGINKWIGIGNVCKDPQVNTLPNGGKVANITIACGSSWKDKGSGEKKERTEFVRVVFFKGLAGIVTQYIEKGSQVYIEGELQTRKWEDSSGVTRYTTEIVAQQMKMLGGRPQTTSQASQPSAPQSDDDFDADSIPF